MMMAMMQIDLPDIDGGCVDVDVAVAAAAPLFYHPSTPTTSAEHLVLDAQREPPLSAQTEAATAARKPISLSAKLGASSSDEESDEISDDSSDSG